MQNTYMNYFFASLIGIFHLFSCGLALHEFLVVPFVVRDSAISEHVNVLYREFTFHAISLEKIFYKRY